MNPRYAWLRQSAALVVLLLLWEAAGRNGLLNPLFMPSPSQIGAALIDLFGTGRIWPHLEATFTAALGGLALGIAVGILLGVLAALVPLMAELLEPVMTLLNAVPRVIGRNRRALSKGTASTQQKNGQDCRTRPNSPHE